MEASSDCLEVIKQFEGFQPEPYMCPGGYMTIGYGHMIRDGEQFGRIDRVEAERLLLQDVAVAERAVARLIEVPLHQGQFDALVDFTFNLGSGALQRSTLRRRLNRGRYRDVPKELRRWVHAGGRRLKGLVRRREADVDMWEALPWV